MDAEDAERIARVQALAAAYRAGTLLDLCDVILATGMPLNERLVERIQDTDYQRSVPHLPRRITEREREIMELAFQGLTNKEIATELFISVNTVRNHVRHVYAKLGVRNLIQAMRKLRPQDLQSKK